MTEPDSAAPGTLVTLGRGRKSDEGPLHSYCVVEIMSSHGYFKEEG